MNNEEKQFDGRALFATSSTLLMIALKALGCFWALSSKKFGTVGTRIYFFDFFWSFFLLLALASNYWFPDAYFFGIAFVLQIVLYFAHLITTYRQKHHIPTYYMGNDRLGRIGSLASGGLLGCLLGAVGVPYFGLFLILSAFAHSFYIGLVEERDRRRAVHYHDALAEQEYMMGVYERYKHGGR